MKKLSMIIEGYGVIESIANGMVYARVYDTKTNELIYSEISFPASRFPGYQRKNLCDNVIFSIRVGLKNNKSFLNVHLKYRINLIPLSEERKLKVAAEKKERQDIINYISNIPLIK